MRRVFLVVLSVGLIVFAFATPVHAVPINDPLTGAWAAKDPDGSTTYSLFGAPGSDGVRHYALFDTYTAFCEVNGEPGSGSSVIAHGAAVEDGTTVRITLMSLSCSNGAPGAAQPPLSFTGTEGNGVLDFGGELARRIGLSYIRFGEAHPRGVTVDAAGNAVGAA